MNRERLEAALLDLRALVARPDNDFSWSSWRDTEHALAEIDGIVAEVRAGATPSLWILLVPTGPAQELSLSSGWGDAYCAIAERIEEAVR